jgi:hypothetical protein
MFKEKNMQFKKITCALRTWWTEIKSQPDTIQVSPDATHSLLTYESIVTEIDGFTDQDSLDVSNVIEVYEESGLIAHYIYLQDAMTQELATHIATHTINVNPKLSFGHFEIYTTENTNEHFLRYRSSIYVQSVESDLVPVINDLIDMSSAQFILGIEKFTPWSNLLFEKNNFLPESEKFKNFPCH